MLFLLKVTHAHIERVADLVGILPPDLTDAPASPPDPGSSRLQCFFIFECDSPGGELSQAQGTTWWATNLRELSCDMDKEHSRTVSRLAIPQLINEINVLRDPQQAAKRFGIMALDPDLSWASMERAEEDVEGPLA